MTAILLSVRPIYADALLSGRKTAEVRRRFPEQPSDVEVFLYSSTPVRAVVGTVRLDSIDRPDTSSVWDLYRNEIEIPEGPLSEYLAATESAAILRVSQPKKWARPVSLADLRRVVGIEPPQSFRYLDARRIDQLRGLAGSDLQASRPEPAPLSVAR